MSEKILTPRIKVTADQILEHLIIQSSDKIWASELPFKPITGTVETRIDFFTLEPTKSKNFRTQSFEIKVSRSDFQKDSLTKQQSALIYSNRFWYVTPANMLLKSEIPEWAGLLEFTPGEGDNIGSLKTIKMAPKRDVATPNWQFVVNLIRNSGEIRRDVGLLKQEAKFWKHLATQYTQAAKFAIQRCERKFNIKWGSI